MASFLYDKALLGLCRWHGRLCLPQWFLEVFLGPFSNVNDRIMPMSDAVSSEGPKTTGVQQSFSDLSFTQRFLQFLWIFDDAMHCRLCNLQSLCNLMLRNVVLKVFHNFFMHSFTDWRASAHLLRGNLLCLSKTSLLCYRPEVNQLNLLLDVLPAESFQHFLLFQPFVAPVPTFLRIVAGIKFEMSSFIFIFMHLADFYPKWLTVHAGYIFFQYVYYLWIEPTPFALLTQCSTTEPQEHFSPFSG